uniref:AlNc14C1297G12876 protein n=1 Tax=Albugo laibachii Nc14 TaxID=890382 RepID=F0X2M5_9STRA|nr:AlNc14C1297G12876 [Albugo laibachii Nc14]|eukprot:CCA28141.1 AlNc14C1297G12876 [Albugo laibachii Nc14]
MLEAFFANCNSDWKCYIRKDLPSTYQLNDLTRTSLQHIDYDEGSTDVENSIFWFDDALMHELKVHERHSLSKRVEIWKEDLSPFIGRQDLDISVFWLAANQEKEMAEKINAIMDNKSKNFVSLPIPKEITTKTIQNSPRKVMGNLRHDETLVRCIIIPGVAHDAVCRECLAMNSIGFAIRTYHLMHESQYSGEICVFPSDHEQEIIIGNCQNTFCHQIFPLDRSDCDTIDGKLSNHLAFPIEEDMVDELSATKRESVHENDSKKGNCIGRIMKHIALKRMARA